MRNRSIETLPVVLAKGWMPVKLMVYDVSYLHFHKNIELGYCVSGEGISYVDGTVYPFSAGDVQIIFPYQKHLSKNTTEIPSTWYWINIDPVEIMSQAGFTELDQINNWIANEIGICGIVNKERYPDIYEGIRRLIDPVCINAPHRIHRKEEFAADFLSLLIRICNHSTNLEKLIIKQDERVEMLAPALQLVKASLENETMPSVIQMSEACHMSVANFRKIFHHTFGVSPKEYILACVIHKAKKELILSEKSITEIASMVGYRNISGFNRCFLELTGMTPTEFRLSLQRYQD